MARIFFAVLIALFTNSQALCENLYREAPKFLSCRQIYESRPPGFFELKSWLGSQPEFSELPVAVTSDGQEYRLGMIEIKPLPSSHPLLVINTARRVLYWPIHPGELNAELEMQRALNGDREDPPKVSLKDLRVWVQHSSIRTPKQWKLAFDRGQLPLGAQRNPFPSKLKGRPGWKYLLRGRWSFEETRAWIQKSTIRTAEQWQLAMSEHRIPSGIPAAPTQFYKTRWIDLFGVVEHKHTAGPFQMERNWAHRLGIQTLEQWESICQSGQLPPGMSPEPWIAFPTEWRGLSDFLGTLNDPNLGFLPFDESRIWARTSAIKNPEQWRHALAEGKIPLRIPPDPEAYYGDAWLGWSDYLNVTMMMPFTEARSWARRSGIKRLEGWKLESKYGLLPKGMPSNPWTTYKNEWKGLADFLGTENKKELNFAPFDEVRTFARQSGIQSCEQWMIAYQDGRLPPRYPAKPWVVYKGQWIDSYDFFGKPRPANVNAKHEDPAMAH